MSDIHDDGRESQVNVAIKDAFTSLVVEKGAPQGAVVTETEIMRNAIAQNGDRFSAQDLRTAFYNVYHDGIIPTCYAIVDEHGALVFDEDGQLAGTAETLESLKQIFEAKRNVSPYIIGSHVKLPTIVERQLSEKQIPIVRVDAAFVIS